MSNSEGICRVGYALNAKKLRKGDDSGKDATSKVVSAGHSTPSSSGAAEGAASTKIWRGGGLADIISDGVEIDGVQFIPWDYEIPVHEQVGWASA